jgi:hypothetical protein
LRLSPFLRFNGAREVRLALMAADGWTCDLADGSWLVAGGRWMMAAGWTWMVVVLGSRVWAEGRLGGDQ